MKRFLLASASLGLMLGAAHAQTTPPDPPVTWSFYGTLSTSPLPPPAVYSGSYTETNGPGGIVVCSMINAATLNCVLTPPLQHPGQ